MNKKLSFVSDYMEGAHPAILKRLIETNMFQTPGYGYDSFSESAKEKIRSACKAPNADVFFLTGGTQTNATVIDALLKPYQGVIAASTGHINVHESGAIEAGGHKVLALPGHNGKLNSEDIDKYVSSYWADENFEHMVMPGMVYISQPTEYGTLYSLEELTKISNICHEKGLQLYVDGARLAYALSSKDNDVSLTDLAMLCDAFYIGGTKCGTLFGEAVVFPEHNKVPHFFAIVKQHGALMAKGRIAGIQFDTLFTDGLYEAIGKNAISAAERIREALLDLGYKLYIDSPTNQIFVVLTKEEKEELSKHVDMGFMENLDEDHSVMRFATSWATKEEDVDELIACLKDLRTR